jgi:DNA-binding transcriptional LysR family regulator
LARRINHRQLEAFLAVMNSGTVTAAAERLFITQPAASRLIRDLESSIGFPLFERHKGRLLPTVEAQALYQEVERSFTGLDKILRTAEDIRSHNLGALRIAAMPALALSFLPRIIALFSARHPNVTISLQIRSSATVLDWIASQQYDVGFASHLSSHPAVEEEVLLAAPQVAILPEGHRLAAKASLEPADFEGESFIAMGQHLNMRSLVDGLFTDAGVTLRQQIDVQLSEAVARMVAAGAGVALIDPVTAGEQAGQGIEVRPFRPAIVFPFKLFFPRHRARSTLLAAFLALVKEELKRNPYVT